MAQLDLATLVVKIKSDSTQYKQGVDQAQSKTRQFGVDAKQLIGGAVAGAFAVAAAAAVKFAQDSLVEFEKFETGMSEVFTLLPGLSEEAMGALEQQALEAGSQMGRIPDETIPALYQALSAGVPQDNVFEFLATANAAAIGGVTDLETAVSGISSVVNAYGADIISAGQASDLMFTAVKGGITTFDELSNSLFNVTPIASSLQVEFGNITAALATMTAQKVPTSVATTQLRQLLIELSQAGGEAALTFERMAGQTFVDFVASGGNLQDALQLMEQAAADSGVRLSDMFGSVEAGSAALALTGANTEKFSSELVAAAQSAGATEEAASQFDGTLARMEDTVSAQTSELMVLVASGLAPTKRAWLELKGVLLEAAIASAKDSVARRENYQAMREQEGVAQDVIGQIHELINASEGLITTTQGNTEEFEAGYEAIDAIDAVYNRHTGTLEEVEANGRALNSMLVLLQNGFVGTGAELAAAAIQMAEFGTGTQVVATGMEYWTLAADSVTVAAGGVTEAVAAQSVNTDLLMMDVLDATAVIVDMTASQEAAAEASRLEAEAVAVASAALAGYFVAATQATDAVGFFSTTTTDTGVVLVDSTVNQQAMNLAMYDAAAAAGASAVELAVLGVATGVLSAEQAEAALKTAILQAGVAELAAAYVAGDLSIAGLRTEMNNLVADVNNMDVEIGTSTGEVDIYAGSLTNAGSAALAAAEHIGGLKTAAEDAAGDYQIHFDITTTGSIPDATGDGGATHGGYQNPGENAAGTDFWGGGWTWVGEEGPELLNLPTGSEVVSNDESMAMMGGSTKIYNIDARGSNMTERQIRQIFIQAMREVGEEADYVGRSRG